MFLAVSPQHLTAPSLKPSRFAHFIHPPFLLFLFGARKGFNSVTFSCLDHDGCFATKLLSVRDLNTTASVRNINYSFDNIRRTVIDVILKNPFDVFTCCLPAAVSNKEKKTCEERNTVE